VPTFAQQVALFNAATHGVAPSSALYTVEIGGDDLLNVLQSGATATQALALMRGAAATETTGIAALIGQGARNFLVGLLPDVGKTPSITVLGPAASVKVSALAAAYNVALVANLSRRARGCTAFTLGGEPRVRILLPPGASLRTIIPSVTGVGWSIPLSLILSPGVSILSGVGAGPPPDGVR
jgi:hypothetical protein